MTKQKQERKSLERTLSEEELKDVIAHAEALQRYDEVKQDERLLQDLALASLSSEMSEEGYSTDIVYEVAKQLEIPQRYVERVMSLRHPSQEEMLVQLEDLNAKPSGDLNLKHYIEKADNFSNILLETLKSFYPEERFFMEAKTEKKWFPDRSYNLYRISREKKFLFFGYNKKNLLGNIVFWEINTSKNSADLAIYIGDPLLTSVCREVLNTLKKDFKEYIRGYKVEYNYEVR